MEADYVSARGTFTSIPPAVAAQLSQPVSPQPVSPHASRRTATAATSVTGYETDTALLQDAALLYAQHPCRAFQVTCTACTAV